MHPRKQFAPVAPIGVLEYLQEKNMLGAYHLVLSHNVVQNEPRFTRLFTKMAQYYNPTVIVDNSVIELGHPAEPEVIAKASQIIREATRKFSTPSNVIAVLPDELLNCEGTIKATEEAYNVFCKHSLGNLMFVPQGASFDSIVKCAERFASGYESIRWIGVAKNFVKVLGSRQEITKVLQCIFPQAEFHMLGFSRNTTDDILSTRLPGVKGIDSSMPLRCDESISFTSEFAKRGDWWDDNMQGTDLQVENVKRVRKWLDIPQ